MSKVKGSIQIGVLGLGKMGEAIVQGLARQGKGAGREEGFHVTASTRSHESAIEARRKLKIEVGTDNAQVASEATVLILCVKPHQAEKVVREIQPRLTSRHLLISICAAITTEQLRAWSGGQCAVIRAMPNTPCLIGEGMTVLALGSGGQPAHLKTAEHIFSAVGLTATVEEHLMDGVTGLSGCGPAYIYLVIEALSDAGVKVGLPRQTSTLLAAQTLLGAARMVLSRDEHPASLKDEVTTPAGCTIDGLMALEEGKLRVTLIKAVVAAARRSRTLRGE